MSRQLSKGLENLFKEDPRDLRNESTELKRLEWNSFGIQEYFDKKLKSVEENVAVKLFEFEYEGAASGWKDETLYKVLGRILVEKEKYVYSQEGSKLIYDGVYHNLIVHAARYNSQTIKKPIMNPVDAEIVPEQDKKSKHPEEKKRYCKTRIIIYGYKPITAVEKTSEQYITDVMEE